MMTVIVATTVGLVLPHAWADTKIPSESKKTSASASGRDQAQRLIAPTRTGQGAEALGLRGSLSSDDVTGALPPPGLERQPALRDEGLFGSVEIPVRTTVASARWRDLVAARPARFFEACDGRGCEAPLHRAFEAVKAARPAGLSLELLRDVNAAVNRAVAFRPDDVIWGASDYWASPEETAVKGAGDCEDFAIAKFGILQALGVPASSMRIAVVKDLRKGIGHALLVVRAGDVSWVLDNQATDVRPDTAVTGYTPLYTLSIDGAWVHGVRRGIPVSAADKARPVNLRPSLN